MPSHPYPALVQARRETLARVDPAKVALPTAVAVRSASVQAFHVAVAIAARLVAGGGIMGLIAFRRPRRRVRAEDCAAAQFVAQPLAAAQGYRSHSAAVDDLAPT